LTFAARLFRLHAPKPGVRNVQRIACGKQAVAAIFAIKFS
jgi:hypothetical protein